MNSKTFRLFISSTFSDFKREREILQSNVFPHIKAYAAQLGYTFLPIDLRWGVSNEAQLDQKTLELCLDEVKACKTFKYPNFLVMLGDRYGWIPLPYAIEAQEFETLCALMTEQEKQDLTDWYMKDLNQLPASYVLKERTGEFEGFEHWEKEEIKLRDLLQCAVKKSSLDENQKSKYFTSATEAEVNEGIISYLKPTPSQIEQINKTKISPEIDAKHVFGFFRSIEPSSKIAETFIADDADQRDAKKFSYGVSKVLNPQNRLRKEVKLIEDGKLDETYLQDFQERVTQFLESKIIAQKESEGVSTPLEIEQKEQKYFAQSKRKNFLGQEKLLKAIADYISDNNQQPLVIYGKSGCGKSALMAQAIQQAQLDLQKSVIYRFVGATANSSSTREILTSIFEELKEGNCSNGEDVLMDNCPSENEPLDDYQLPFNETINGETFDQYCERIRLDIVSLNKEVVIFIDAVDQLHNRDQFLWLPKELPETVKIVISALEDGNYAEDSQYFDELKTKTRSLYEMPEFDKPRELIKKLLNEEGRTLQRDQENYFFKQYQAEPSPLYVSIAAQEIKRWKSDDYIQGEPLKANNKKVSLQKGLCGISQEFIRNLSSIYHHNQVVVNKVLGYIYASKDGLSESEILQLISVDSEFIKSSAPEIWHRNIINEFPVVHWTRLHAQLKPLLSVKTQDNEGLLYFSHREFCDAVGLQTGQKKEHEGIIAATQMLISKNIEKDFIGSRWGKLYFLLAIEYESEYTNITKFTECADFISLNYNKDIKAIIQWIQDFVQYAEKCTVIDARNNKLECALVMAEFYYLITLRLKDKVEPLDTIVFAFVSALQNKALINSELKNFDLSINHSKELFEFYDWWISLKISGVFGKLISNGYITARNNYAVSLKKQNEIQKNQSLTNEIREHEQNTLALINTREIESDLDLESRVNTLINTSISLYDNGNTELAIKNSIEVLKLLNDHNKSNRYNPDNSWKVDRKLNVLTNLVCFYSEVDLNKSVEYGEEAHNLSKELYDQNRELGFQAYFDALINIAGVYHHNLLNQLKFLYEAKLMIIEKYNAEPVLWATDYIKVLWKLLQIIATTSMRQNEVLPYTQLIMAISQEYNLTGSHEFNAAKHLLELYETNQKSNVNLGIIGMNTQLDDFNVNAKEFIEILAPKVKLIYQTISSATNVTDIEEVSKVIDDNEDFRVLLVTWLIHLANLAIVCKENSLVEMAHEFSSIFHECCGSVLWDENIIAVKGTMFMIYKQTNCYKKSKIIDFDKS